jgi:hypothetical protein
LRGTIPPQKTVSIQWTRSQKGELRRLALDPGLVTMQKNPNTTRRNVNRHPHIATNH